MPIENLRHAHRTFLAFGAELEVLDPPELRTLVAESVAALSRAYSPA